MDAKELKLELSKKGYATNTMWHMNDVAESLNEYNDFHETNHQLSAWECQALMNDVVDSDQVKELIFEMIYEAIVNRI